MAAFPVLVEDSSGDLFLFYTRNRFVEMGDSLYWTVNNGMAKGELIQYRNSVREVIPVVIY